MLITAAHQLPTDSGPVPAATFHLRKRKDPRLQFEQVFRKGASVVLDQFLEQLKQFDGRSSVAENLHDLREACKTIETLMGWRNDLIHARVRVTDIGYALYDWRTRQRLEIHRDVIVENIQLAINAMVKLEANIVPLIGQLKFDEELDMLFSTLPELSEPDDNDANPATA